MKFLKLCQMMHVQIIFHLIIMILGLRFIPIIIRVPLISLITPIFLIITLIFLIFIVHL